MSHGEDGREQISWVSWKTICSPKKHGGLRVMEISIFSVTLLAKWKWYLFHNRGSYGKGFLNQSIQGVEVLGGERVREREREQI